ncbi:MAG: hypothetical protein PF689_14545 [Deltaproteobacteria bacterium]|jgi:hypothetical protein|nr:hypothetical protein [Deltaproteobacteria bacterium]
MTHPNNFFISKATRGWLTTETKSPKGQLDRQSRKLLQPAINHCKAKHPGGLVHSLATDMGVTPELAKMAGICAELFYAACSFTDDLQDNDARKYMGEVSLSLLINTQAHLFALSGAAANFYQKKLQDKYSSVSTKCKTSDNLNLCGFLFQTSSQMLNGQYYELQHENWNPDIYIKVAYLSSGKQFSYYLLLALYPNLLDPDKKFHCNELHNWLKWSEYYGIGLQITTDYKTQDPRLLDFTEAELEIIVAETQKQLEATQMLLDYDFKSLLSELYSVFSRICS